jgi:DAACS family dicarboxylate/amino acid:cation (Na+ or H+) symporter
VSEADDHVWSPIAMMPTESAETSTVADDPESSPGGIPLYVWVIAAAVVAVPVGYFWGEGASALNILPNLILRLLKAIATPLVVMATLHAIVSNEVEGKQGARMMLYYFINTTIAICLGLALSNLIKPGLGADLSVAASTISTTAAAAKPEPPSLTTLLYLLFPESIGDAFAKNNLAQLVVVTLALGIGLAKIRNEQKKRGDTSYLVVIDLITIVFELLMRVLLWIVALVPLAVFGVIAANVGRKDFAKTLEALLWFIPVVLIGLACQISWYLAQMAVFAKMSPLRFLAGVKDVMATSFSTASTGATMPMTLKALTGPLKVSRTSSQLAACVGTNFNNDGTALYQASVVLFMAQAQGVHLSFTQQIIVVLVTIVASIGAGNIPSGGFVTLPLIFGAVGLPADNIPIILAVDWFLDRCRTSSNVLGDMTVAVLLDQTHIEPKAVAIDTAMI